jgi:branched-chain amino acid transport system permease protein
LATDDVPAAAGGHHQVAVETFFNHACLVAIFAIFAMSLNLLLGYAGQISIAHAAFGAVGAYMAGFLVTQHGWTFFPAFGAGLAAAFAVGALTSLPALYLDPRYLILLTLALSTAILAVVGAIPELGGSYGLRGVPNLKIFGTEFNTTTEFFRPLIVIALIVLAICWRLAYSPFGRVLRGIRDDELATRGVGKDVVRYKVLVFAITAGMAGVAGIMYLYFNNSAQPGSFDLTQSMGIIAMVVIGGTANLIGSILGATLLVLLDPFLEDVINMSATNAALARASIYGGLIVLFLLVRPQGLLPEGWTPAAFMRWVRRRRGEPGVGPILPPGGGGAFADPELAVETSDGDTPPPPSGPPAPVPAAAPAQTSAATPQVKERPVPAPAAAVDGNGHGEFVLEATGLKKSFGGIHAADDLSFGLRRARVTGLIGPNGAGKTTVFNLLTGVIPPDEGTVMLGGEDITGWTLNSIADAGMARTYQDVRVYPRMSVLENVMLAVPNQPGERLGTAVFRPFTTRRGEAETLEKAMHHLEFVGLAERRHQLVAALAFGEQKLVALARLLATEADVLLLDEPASGVDIDWVERMLSLIADLRNRGKSVCVVEHNLHVVEQVADRIYFMESGRITAEGTMSELMSQERLAEVYFGSA